MPESAPDITFKMDQETYDRCLYRIQKGSPGTGVDLSFTDTIVNGTRLEGVITSKKNRVGFRYNPDIGVLSLTVLMHSMLVPRSMVISKIEEIVTAAIKTKGKKL